MLLLAGWLVFIDDVLPALGRTILEHIIRSAQSNEGVRRIKIRLDLAVRVTRGARQQGLLTHNYAEYAAIPRSLPDRERDTLFELLRAREKDSGLAPQHVDTPVRNIAASTPCLSSPLDFPPEAGHLRCEEDVPMSHQQRK